MKHDFSAFDDHWFDRLADGELPDEQRRALLAALDDCPDGWRRCALAFLEAQALREAIGGAVPTHSTPPSTAKGGASASSWQRSFSRAFSLAACLLLAFCLGLWLERGRHTSPSPGPALASSAEKPSREPRESMALALDESWQSELRVPLFAAEDFESAWPARQSLAPPELLAALEEAGHQVQRRTYWTPLRLDDGRSVLLPVEELDVIPASQRVYQ